jgi:hypothetical protein
VARVVLNDALYASSSTPRLVTNELKNSGLVVEVKRGSYDAYRS